MTESPGNEPSSALFARIQKMVSGRGADIRQNLNGTALKLEFADGQRILINFDRQTQNVWLAARSGGTEFIFCDGSWLANNRSELFSELHTLIEQTIASNPINARPPSPRLEQTSLPEPIFIRTVRERHTVRNVFILVLFGLCSFWVLAKLTATLAASGKKHPGQSTTLSLNKLNLQCENAFPANGSITLFPEGGLRASDPSDPEVTLKNDHTHPVLLLLSAPGTAIPSLSVLIHARQSAVLHLPAGQYDMMFGVGSAWCNPHNGFTDGHLLKFDKPLNVQQDKPVQLTLQTSGSGMDDFQLFIKKADPEADLPAPTYAGDGSMEVKRQANGHFYLPGSIDKVPVTFMVDTGASVTSISDELAHQVGIHNCKEVQFQTANGESSGCIALVPHMTLGNFVLENITVAVMPNLETNLLGANVLRNFQISQNDSSMLIERR